MNYKKVLSLLFFFIIVDVVLYWNLWNTFFQQDEWALFGRAIFQLQNFPLSVITFSGAHFHPLGNLVWIGLYKLFGINAFYYGFLAIVLHSAAAVIAYYFFGIFTKKNYVKFLLSFLFFVSFPTKQVVVWYAANPYIIPCIALVLVFFLYLNKFKTKPDISKISCVFLFLIWLLAFLFREEAVIIIPLLPLFVWFFWNKPISKQLKIKILAFIALTILLVLTRYFIEGIYGEKIVYEKGNIHVMRLYNTLLVPPKMIVQNVIELEQLWDLSKIYNRFAFPERIMDGLIIETAIFEHIVLFLFIPLAFAIGIVFPRMNSYERKIFFFSLAWIFFSSVIVGLQSRRLYYLESRYLYLGSIGVLLLLYSVVGTVYRRRMISQGKVIGGIITLSLIFTIYSYFNIQRILQTYYLPNAITRKDILRQINQIKPTIPKKVVFYIECREEDDCIPNGLILPFQSGVGHMLLVNYATHNESAYAKFFEGYFLWDWEEEGYKEIDGTGFGYYRQYKSIQSDFRNKKFSLDEIVALNYDRSENKIRDITKDIRKKLNDSVQLAR